MVVHINVDDMQGWIAAARYAQQQNLSMSQLIMIALREYMARERANARSQPSLPFDRTQA